MAHTFDIRFARSAGLAGLFEAPANRFGWKGAGKLSVDAGGISIAVRRGLATWFTRRTHRIPAEHLTQVYREGEALRLEYGVDEQRQVLPIWAPRSDVAEQIVKLLPTSRTVEFEESSTPRRFRWDRKLLLATLIVLAAGGVGWWVAGNLPIQSAPATIAETPAVEAAVPAAPAAAVGVAPPPAAATLQPHEIAKQRQSHFEAELTLLRNRYLYLQEAKDADQLAAVKAEWWSTSFHIDEQESLTGPAFTGYREAQLATLSSWRAALSARAAAIRLKDDRFLALADRQRDLADQYELLVRRYVR
jgi:hypothetical protein